MKLFILAFTSVLALSLGGFVADSEFKESSSNNPIIKNLIANDKDLGQSICKDFPYCKLDAHTGETDEIKAANKYLMRA